MTTPKLIDIKKGWLAVYDPKAKIVFGISELKGNGQMTEGASFINTETREELLLEIFKLGLTFKQDNPTPPANSAPVAPKA